MSHALIKRSKRSSSAGHRNRRNLIPDRRQFEMAERMSVAIVAPVHNRKNITLQCLRSISRLNSEGLDISVVIVDDGSTDGSSAEINSEFPTVDVVKGDG